MQWVAKRHKIVAALLVVAIASFFTIVGTIVLSIQEVPDTPQSPHTCFDTATATTTESVGNCADSLLDLGNAPLLEQSDSAGATTFLHPVLLKRFTAARIAAERVGITLYITSGFRTKDRQLQLFKKEIVVRGSETEAAKWVLPPWYSHHPQGLAIDVNYPLDKPGALWLDEFGATYGLCRVYANEWWHFEGSTTPGKACPALIPNAISNLDPSSLRLHPDQ